MEPDPYAARKALSFSQAEGTEPLPSQLRLQEISQELRAKLWSVVYSSLSNDIRYDNRIDGKWRKVLLRKHTHVDHKMSDEIHEGR